MARLAVQFEPTLFKHTQDSDRITIASAQSVLLRVCVSGLFSAIGKIELRRVISGTQDSVVIAEAFATAPFGRGSACEEKWVLLDVADPIVELPGQYFIRVGEDGPLSFLDWASGELHFEPASEVPTGPVDDGSGDGVDDCEDTGGNLPPDFGSGHDGGYTGGNAKGTTKPSGVWERLSPSGRAATVGLGTALLAGLVAFVGRGRGE